LNAGRGERFLSSPEMSQTGCGLTLPFIKCVPGLFLQGRLVRTKVLEFELSNAKVMIGWSYTSTPLKFRVNYVFILT